MSQYDGKAVKKDFPTPLHDSQSRPHLALSTPTRGDCGNLLQKNRDRKHDYKNQKNSTGDRKHNQGTEEDSLQGVQTIK